MSAAAAPAVPDFPIVVIGAGFAGIGMGIQLRKAGIESFTIFERASDIGGTWRDNTYPGAACDVPSQVYSYSFELKPDWSRSFAPAREIHDYLRHCVDAHGLWEKIRLGVEIVEASFDEEAGLWRLTTDAGETVSARFVASGVGGLVDPHPPEIKGLHSFRGDFFHTARWRHDVDLTGRRVAVIGTGASAVQVVPGIAPQVETLSVFQRTAAWVMPRGDRPVSERQKERFRRHPGYQRLVRWALYWGSELLGPLVILDTPLSRLPERISLRHLRESVSDPELRARLTPHFQFGCKRVLVSDDYWSTFERENVELVTEPIEEIEAHHVRTADGRRHPVDVLIAATGFELGLAQAPFPIHGLGGRSLDEVWSRGAVAYKGMTVAGFPNWLIMMGPNTGPGHTSVLVYTEAQIRYALQMIDYLRRGDVRYVDVRQHVQDAWNRKLQRRMKRTSWTRGGCQSWYLSEDGENHALFPGLAAEYVWRARRFRPREYRVVR